MIDPRRAGSVGLVPLAVALLAAAGCSNSTLSTPPPNMPAAIPAAELAGLPGVAYSDIVEAAGPPAARPGAVHAGEALVTFRYRYRHTAVLTEDVTGFSITVRGVKAPAGSPGYYAGTFTTNYGRSNKAPFDMWCFLASAAGRDRDPLCLLRNLPGLAAIAPTRKNPWLWYQFSPMTGTFNYVHTPIFERRRVDLPVDLVLEYRFKGWRGEEAQVGLYAVGRHVVDLPVPRDPSGKARLRTVAGDFVISKISADPTAARIAAALG
jgi:hypothetical protein